MRNPFLRSSGIVVVFCAILVSLSLFYWSGCSDKQDIANPSATTQQSFIKLSTDDQAVQAVMTIQDRHTAELMADKNVVGTATGLTDDGRLAVLVLLEKPVGTSVKGAHSVLSMPTDIEGIPIVLEVVGKIKPLDGGAAHQVIQTPPIQLGTSGGWRFNLSNGFCCSGTLGSLVHV